MAEARKVSGKLALWALAYIALSFGVVLTIPPLTSELGPESYIDLSGQVFAPFLGAWLGWRHGRAALLPLLIAAPLELFQFNYAFTAFFSIYHGIGFAVLALTAATTLIFASQPNEKPAHGIPGVVLDAALLALTTVALSACFYSLEAPFSICISLSSLAGIVAFALVASGRRSLLSVLAILAVAIGALWALDLAHIKLPFTTIRPNDAFSVRIGWEGAPPVMAYIPIPAALAGASIRQLRLAHVRNENPRLGLAMAATAALIIIPATLSPANTLLRHAFETKGHAAIAAPTDAVLVRYELLQDQLAPEEIVVTAAAPRHESVPDVSIIFWSILVLAAASFVMGRASRRASFFLPLALEAGTVALALINAFLFPTESDAPLSFRIVNVLYGHADALVALGVVSWMFAWLGARPPVAGAET